jgi:hypothetical protein
MRNVNIRGNTRYKYEMQMDSFFYRPDTVLLCHFAPPLFDRGSLQGALLRAPPRPLCSQNDNRTECLSARIRCLFAFPDASLFVGSYHFVSAVSSTTILYGCHALLQILGIHLHPGFASLFIRDILFRRFFRLFSCRRW